MVATVVAFIEVAAVVVVAPVVEVAIAVVEVIVDVNTSIIPRLSNPLIRRNISACYIWK